MEREKCVVSTHPNGEHSMSVLFLDRRSVRKHFLSGRRSEAPTVAELVMGEEGVNRSMTPAVVCGLGPLEDATPTLSTQAPHAQDGVKAHVPQGTAWKSQRT